MTKDIKNRMILLTPGPVPMSPAVQKSLSSGMIHHRSRSFVFILEKVRTQLKKVFQTQEEVHILNSNGTGAMEAAVSNLFSKGDEVIHVCGGKFGDRWYEISKEYQLQAHKLEVPLGEAVSIESIQKMLQQFPQSKAIFVQACETSTATFNPIKEIAQITKNLNLLLIVDAITALSVVDLPMDKWGIDVLIGGSQKSFAIPAGLSFIALSKKAQKFQEESAGLPCYYWSLKRDKKAIQKKQTAFSTNVTFIRALNTSLEEMLSQGGSSLQKKYKSLQESCLIFSKRMGIDLFSKSPGPALTAFLLPPSVHGQKVKDFMEKNQVMIGGGQEALQGKIIRFGHMGSISFEDQIEGLKCFGLALIEQDSQLFTQEKLTKAIDDVQTYFNSIEI